MRKAISKSSILIILLLATMFSCENTIGPNEEVDVILSQTQVDNEQKGLLKDDGDYYVLGGDMLLDKSDPDHQVLIDSLLGKVSNSRGVIKDGVKFWEDGLIPYYYEDSRKYGDWTNEDKKIVEEAILEIEKVCSVNFYETHKPPNIGKRWYKLKIEKYDEVNDATYGYVRRSIMRIKNVDKWVIVHELMHVLGIHHEHQRPDRDDYIAVNEDNIEKDYKFAFEKFYYKDSRRYGPYDYDSIMHYGSYDFSKNKKKTIESHGHYIGRNWPLSKGDIEILQYLYGGTLELGYDHLPRGFADVDGSGSGRADFLPFCR